MKFENTLLGIFASVTIAIAQPSIPVDLHTGRPTITIPVAEVGEGDINVPIFISYSGDGVRVGEGEGTAGMSWSLAGGGAVYRGLRGLPDDYLGTGTDLRKGWLYNSNAQAIQNFTSSSNDDMSSCADEVADYNFLNGVYEGYHDTEPDLFSFQAPGLSGQFVFGADGLPKLIPYQDLKITITRVNGTGPIEEITVKTNKGVEYSFNVKETIKKHTSLAQGVTSINYFQREYKNYKSPATYTSAWQLASIKSPTGAEVLFGYYTSETAMSGDKVTIINEANSVQSLYSISQEISQRQLQTISTNTVTATFTWEDNRIDRVVIAQFGRERKFDFVYQRIKDARDTNIGYPASRSFLKEIKQVEDCVTFPAFRFDYEGVSGNTTDLPFKEEMFQDLWGYYNGTSTTRVPDVYVYNSQTNAERFRLSTIPGQSPNSTLVGASRMVNANVIASGSLTRIHYPSGSFAQIDYEPNQYFDAVANASLAGGGIRVKSIKLTGAEKGSASIITDYEYLAVDGQTSGRLLYRPVFAFYDGTSIVRSEHNLAPDGGVYYLRATVKQTGKGKTVYDFLAPNMYPTTAQSDWNATKSKVARIPVAGGQPCTNIGTQVNAFYSFPFPANTNYDFERGLLDKVTIYNETGATVQEKIYTYARLTTTAVTIKGIAFDRLPQNFVFGQYTILANLNKLTQTETVRNADELTPANKIESLTTYKYNSSHHMLDSVLVSNSDGSIHKTKYRYAKDFVVTNPNSSNVAAVAMKGLNDNNRHGELIETLQFLKPPAAAQQVVGASLSLYKDFGSGKILPHQTYVQPPTTGYTLTTVSGSPQIISVGSPYKLIATVQSYNDIGLPISMLNDKRRKSGVHYAYNGIPVASLSNAYGEEAFYHGFEPVAMNFSTITPSGSGSATVVSGWIGTDALSIPTGTYKLTSNALQKGGAKYRFSCWAKATGSPTITFKAMNGATAQATGTVVYNSAQANQWQYLEAELNTTAVNNTFTLEISTSAVVELDEVRFHPAHAAMTTTSVVPMLGVTSETDDRGVSAFKEYDFLGRVRFIKNQDKHIVQIHDYQYKTQTSIPINSEFTDNIPDYLGLEEGNSALFTAPANCDNVTYQWEVNGQTVSTNAILSHFFSNAGGYEVKLTVTSISGSEQSVKRYCIRPDPELILSAIGSDQIDECSATHLGTARIGGELANTIGCSGESEICITWYYKLSSMNVYAFFPSGSFTLPDFKTITFNLDMLGLQSVTVKCVVEGHVVRSNNDDCDGTYYFSGEATKVFTYIDQPYCP